MASLNDDEIIDPTLRIEMKGMSAYIELDVIATESMTLSIPLIPSPLNLVQSVIRGFDASLGFEINLVFSLTGAVDIHGGFIVDFPDDVFFEAGIFDGVMSSLSL